MSDALPAGVWLHSDHIVMFDFHRRPMYERPHGRVQRANPARRYHQCDFEMTICDAAHPSTRAALEAVRDDFANGGTLYAWPHRPCRRRT